jgi:hypothetical protein
MHPLKRLWLRWELAHLEMYIADCRRDGLLDSLDIAAFNRKAQEMRVEIARLTPRSKACAQ